MLSMLSSREWAAVFWLGALVLVAAWTKAGRKSLHGVLRAFLKPAVLGVFLTFFAWIALSVAVGHRVGLWTFDLLGTTIFWTLTAGVVLLFKFDAAAKDSRFIPKQVRNLLALTLFVDFLVSAKTFSLWVEIPLQGVVGFLAVAAAYGSSFPEYAASARFINGMLSIAAVVLIVLGFDFVVNNTDTILTVETARAVALPLWLGIWALPLIVVLGLYSNLDRNFRMMGLEQPSRAKRFRNILPLALRLGFKPEELHGFRNYWERQIALASGIQAADKVVTAFIDHREAERDAVAAEEAELAANAGVDGEDEYGRRLDRREFKETWRALDWVSTCHMGWYGNKTRGTYKAEKIQQIIEMRDWNELPAPHGIHMVVSEDRQAWYAWRRTVSGWVLAVGGRDGSNLTWRYDGPEPPQTFPGPGAVWGETLAGQMESPNW